MAKLACRTTRLVGVPSILVLPLKLGISTRLIGLGFATFLTLILVPAMYFIGVNTTAWFRDKFKTAK